MESLQYDGVTMVRWSHHGVMESPRYDGVTTLAENTSQSNTAVSVYNGELTRGRPGDLVKPKIPKVCMKLRKPTPPPLLDEAANQNPRNESEPDSPLFWFLV
ncbi:hypothetical protein EYF80_032282 [Liparis tanakae]|uniref:Uncharacterized protein n=1 Tax=Liparis tanakae TaxID=230148 RepID=A0A4Z2GV82_9TELE|nr:hypothetical protein EYF80_032282 [Liparis tanakae]